MQQAAIPAFFYEEAAAYIRETLAPAAPPDTALVLGSGLSALAGELEGAAAIPYAHIPHFPRTTNAAHPGVLYAGRPARRFSVLPAAGTAMRDTPWSKRPFMWACWPGWG